MLTIQQSDMLWVLTNAISITAVLLIRFIQEKTRSITHVLDFEKAEAGCDTKEILLIDNLRTKYGTIRAVQFFMFPLGYRLFELDILGTSSEVIGISVSIAVLVLLIISMNNKFLYLKPAVFVYSALLITGITISVIELSKGLEFFFEKNALLMSTEYQVYLKSLFNQSVHANFELLMYKSQLEIIWFRIFTFLSSPKFLVSLYVLITFGYALIKLILKAPKLCKSSSEEFLIPKKYKIKYEKPKEIELSSDVYNLGIALMHETNSHNCDVHLDSNTYKKAEDKDLFLIVQGWSLATFCFFA